MDTEDILPWSMLLAQILAQAQNVVAAIGKPGGATKEDLVALASEHDSLRDLVRRQIEAMPDK